MTGFALGVQRVWQRYLYHLDRRPLYTQALNTGIIMAAGDAISQFFAEGRRSLRDFDVHRTLRFAFVGCVIAGPAMTVWYRALDRRIVGTKTSMAVRKTFLDQALFLPVYLIGFVGIMGVLRRDKIKVIEEKLARDFKPLLLASYSIWPAVQVVNFYLLPLRHRVLAINVVCLFWNSYVAWKAEEGLCERETESSMKSSDCEGN